MSTNTHEVLTGICACCLGRFVVEGKSVVLHGYKRPGDGVIRGRCMGMNYPAYEISTEEPDDLEGVGEVTTRPRSHH